MKILLRRSDIYSAEQDDAPAQSTIMAFPISDKNVSFLKEAIMHMENAPRIVKGITCSDILTFEVMFWDYTFQVNGETDTLPFENFTEEALDALTGVDLHIWELLEDYNETIVIEDSTMEMLQAKMKGYGVKQIETAYPVIKIDRLWQSNLNEITQFEVIVEYLDYGAGYVMNVKDILGEKK